MKTLAWPRLLSFKVRLVTLAGCSALICGYVGWKAYAKRLTAEQLRNLLTICSEAGPPPVVSVSPVPESTVEIKAADKGSSLDPRAVEIDGKLRSVADALKDRASLLHHRSQLNGLVLEVLSYWQKHGHLPVRLVDLTVPADYLSDFYKNPIVYVNRSNRSFVLCAFGKEGGYFGSIKDDMAAVEYEAEASSWYRLKEQSSELLDDLRREDRRLGGFSLLRYGR